MSVSIIGTAGRDENTLNADLFTKMVERAHEIIISEFKLDPSEVTLVSGGAAWSDHIAVKLFLEKGYKALKVYLPCEWDFKNSMHVDTGEYDWKKNAGKSANKYHKLFSKCIKEDTLKELESIQNKEGGEFVIGNGFHSRNDKIAKSKFMIAFSFAENENSISGGTGYTWKKSNSNFKIHVNISSLE